MTKLRFWHYGIEPVLITIKAGQTLRHSTGGATDEGWSRVSNIWHFDGQVLTLQWCSDGRDCDGRLTRTGECFCPVADIKAGYQEENEPIAYPKWQQGESSQRDYSAEAMGY